MLSVAGIPVRTERMQVLLRRATRSVALALADHDIRAKVYDALEGSAYRENKLHFGTLLRADVGELLTNMAAADLTTEAAILSMLDSIIDLEFYMPVPEHRRKWTGGEDLIVASQLFDDGTIPIGFDLKGKEVYLHSADQPPTVPALVIVPVETDFASVQPNSDQTAQLPANPASETPGIYLTYSYVFDKREGWPRGSPEIEAHVFRRESSTTYYDFSCAGENMAPSSGRYFNQDGNTWSGRVLVATQSEIQDTSAYDEKVFVQLWEDDGGGHCLYGAHPSYDGMPPNLQNQEKRDSVRSLQDRVIKIQWWSPVQDSVEAQLRGVGNTIAYALGSEDDVVGVTTLAGGSAGCWAEPTGPETFSLYIEGGTHNGWAYLDWAFDHVREPMCELQATISGPEAIVINGDGTYSPIPRYTANVSGEGAGTTSYEWKDGGTVVTTSSSYTISPVVASTHYITLKVTRGSATDTSPTKTVTITENEGGEEAPAHKGKG